VLNRRLSEIIIFLAIFIATSYGIIASYQHNGFVADELAHFPCGVEWWQTGKYSIELLHPPIARIAMASLPHLLLDYELTPEYLAKLNGNSDEIHYIMGHQDYISQHPQIYSQSADKIAQIKTFMRLTQLPFLAILMLAVYVWVKENTSKHCAYLALLLLVTIPSILCWSALAMTDLPPTAFTIWALYMFNRWAISPTKTHSLLLGIFTGLAFCSKFSTIPFLFLAFVGRLIIDDLINRKYSQGFKAKYVVGVLLSTVSCLFVISCVYRFSFTKIELCSLLPGYCAHSLFSNLNIYIPAPEFFLGILALLARDSILAPQFFMGKLFVGSGHFMYFPTIFFFKTPITFLLLIFAAIFLMIRQKKLRSLEVLYPLCAAVCILIIAMVTSINIGLRHIISIYPLLVIFISIVLYQTANLKALILACILQLLICYNAFPHYLNYFNFLAGPNPEYISNDSNFDFGQSLHFALKSLNDRGIEKETILLTFPGYPESYNFTNIVVADFGGKMADFATTPKRRYYLISRGLYVVLSAEDKTIFNSLKKIDFAPDTYLLFENNTGWQ
jgi:hypothetical protein